MALRHSPVMAMDFACVFFICREQRMIGAMFIKTPRNAPMSGMVLMRVIPIRDRASQIMAGVMVGDLGLGIEGVAGEGDVCFPQY